MKWIDNIRPQLALFQAALFCLIVASGTVFMHKHKTADGRIVIHIHPYNLKTDPDATKHHQSASQIHLLDVVFQGSIVQTGFFSYVQPVFAPIPMAWGVYRVLDATVTSYADTYLRGPPQIG